MRFRTIFAVLLVSITCSGCISAPWPEILDALLPRPRERPPSKWELEQEAEKSRQRQKLIDDVERAIESDNLDDFKRRVFVCNDRTQNDCAYSFMTESFSAHAARHGSMRVLEYLTANLGAEERLRELNLRLLYLSQRNDCGGNERNDSEESASVRSLARTKGFHPDNVSMWLATVNCQVQVLSYWLSSGYPPPTDWASAKVKIDNMAHRIDIRRMEMGLSCDEKRKKEIDALALKYGFEIPFGGKGASSVNYGETSEVFEGVSRTTTTTRESISTRQK